MDSITSELRAGGTYRSPSNRRVFTEEELIAIADRIDAEHERVKAESIIDMTDEGMAEHGWVRLPVGEDGDVLHIGELVDERLPFGGYAAPAPIDTMELSRGASGYRWMVKLDAENGAFINPKLLRHHHAPTVEDVLEEFVARWMETHHDDIPALKAEYAAKLALRGDE